MNPHLHLCYGYSFSQGLSSLYSVFIPTSQWCVFSLIAQVELFPSHTWLHLCWLDEEQGYMFLVQPLAEEDPCFQALKDKFISE